MLKNFSDLIFNMTLKHTRIIRTAAVNQSLVPFKNLLKDVFIENMKFEGHSPTHFSEVVNEGMEKTVYLKQPFQQTVIKPLSALKDPFLLIPLFKIHDYKGNPVNYKFFEGIDLNRLHQLANEEYFIQLPHTIDLDILSVELQEEGRSIDLINPLLMGRRGILIFKAPDSDCAMIYLGVFINEEILNTHDNALGRVYAKYIFNDNPCFELLHNEKLSIVLRLNFRIKYDEYKFILGIPARNEEKHYFSFDLHPQMVLQSCVCTVTLSPVLKVGQMFFEVHKSFEGVKSNETPEGTVFVMDFTAPRARKFYEKFVSSIEEPVAIIDEASSNDSEKDSGNDSDASSCAVESD